MGYLNHNFLYDSLKLFFYDVHLKFFFKFYIGVCLIYNAVLVSA